MDAQRGIARRMVIGLPPDGLSPAWERDFAAYPPAGVILFGRDFRDLDDLRRLTSRLRELARPRRIFIATDEEGGFVSQLSPHLVVPPNAARLARRELAPFRAHLEADSVMTAHVVYPALDPERPATFSRTIVHDLLRTRLGFEGVCITDALEMKGAAAGREPAEVARLALDAGCDLLLFAWYDETVRRARLDLAKSLVDGKLERASFDAARPRLERLDRERPEPHAAPGRGDRAPARALPRADGGARRAPERRIPRRRARGGAAPLGVRRDAGHASRRGAHDRRAAARGVHPTGGAHMNDREFLRHTVATLAYRAAKATRGAPETFASFRAGPISRTPVEVLAHMGDLLDWALAMAKGAPRWNTSTPLPWNQERERFFVALKT